MTVKRLDSNQPKSFSFSKEDIIQIIFRMRSKYNKRKRTGKIR